MKLRQLKRNMIGMANLNDAQLGTLKDGLDAKVRSRSLYAGPPKDSVIEVDQYIQVGVELKSIKIPDTKITLPAIRKDAFNLAKLAVSNNNHGESINFLKLAEIKKCLMSKFEQKTNFLDVYKFWDQKGNGKMQASNIKSTLADMNIRVTDKEAQILLSSADMRQTNQWGACEVYNLLYDKGTSLTLPDELQAKANNNIVEYLHDENRIRERKRKEDDLNKLLSGQAGKFIRGFKMLDNTSQGEVNKEQFTKVFRRIVYLRDSLVSDNEMGTIFDEHKNANNTFNYDKFLKKIQGDHRPNYATVVPRKIESQPHEQHFTIQSLDLIKKQAIPPIIQVKKNYQTEDELKRFLKHHFQLDELAFNTATISQSQLTNVFMKASGAPNPKDVEGMLNLYVYDGDEQIHIKDILRPIYGENPMQMYQRLNIRKSGFTARSQAPSIQDKTSSISEDMKQTARKINLSQRHIVEEDDLFPSKKKTLQMLDYVRGRGDRYQRHEKTPKLRQKIQNQDRFTIEGIRDSSYFISEQKRLNYDKTEYSVEQKMKKKEQDAGRLLRIRDQCDRYNIGIKEQEERSQKKIQNYFEEKQRIRASYEQRNIQN